MGEDPNSSNPENTLYPDRSQKDNGLRQFIHNNRYFFPPLFLVILVLSGDRVGLIWELNDPSSERLLGTLFMILQFLLTILFVLSFVPIISHFMDRHNKDHLIGDGIELQESDVEPDLEGLEDVDIESSKN